MPLSEILTATKLDNGHSNIKEAKIMRGTIAKKLRAKARAISKPTQYTYKNKTSIICTGYRRIYQDLKKAYKKHIKL